MHPNLRHIAATGSHKQYEIIGDYDSLVAILGEPNATQLDDPDKVAAAWGVIHRDGRRLCVWCYKRNPSTCRVWSAYGSQTLLDELFVRPADEVTIKPSDRVPAVRKGA